MVTFSGLVLPDDPVEMTPEHVRLEDIASHLARINRWAGATRVPFSVAEHSLHVAETARSMGCNAREMLVGLLHDGHEAYLGDLITPVKARLGPIVHVWARHIDRCIYTALGIEMPNSIETAAVESWDRECRNAEAWAFLAPSAAKLFQKPLNMVPEPRRYGEYAAVGFVQLVQDLKDEADVACHAAGKEA